MIYHRSVLGSSQQYNTSQLQMKRFKSTVLAYPYQIE
jgi:hypothetical protein